MSFFVVLYMSVLASISISIGIHFTHLMPFSCPCEMYQNLTLVPRNRSISNLPISKLDERQTFLTHTNVAATPFSNT